MTRIGRYELQDKLGQGGMGMVFRAHDTVLQRTVALKLLRGDRPEDIERLFREARIAAKLRHPHIVAVHDVGTEDGRHFIAMELVEGVSLEDAKLPVRDALDVVRRAAEAVQHAHEQGVIHRDLKPANILLGSDGRPKVTDFGMAKQSEGQSSLSAEGAIVGTPNYMSPEQASGRAREADARSDVWSLGATLYHLLAGRPPYEGEEAMDVVLRILQTDPEPLPKVHRDIQTIVMKCLERNPRDRYRTASELEADLGRYLDGEPILARPIRWWTRHRGRIAIATAVVLVAAAGGAAWSARDEAARRRVAAEERRHRDDADAAAVAKMEEAREYRELQVLLRDLEADVREFRPYLHVREADVKKSGSRLRERLESMKAHENRFGDFPDYWLALGSALAFLGESGESERSLLRAIELRPGDAAAHYQLGRLYMERAMWAALYEHDYVHKPESDRWSREAREHLAHMGPGVADVEREVCRAFQAYAGGRMSEVVEICTEGIRRHAGDLGVEDLHLLRGFVEKPVQNFREAARLKPNSWWHQCTLGMALFSLNEVEEAVKVLTRSYELFPKAETIAIRGSARSVGGDLDGAIADLETAMRLDPTLALAWFNRGVLRLRRGDWTAAVADFTEALRLRPQYGEAWHGRAKAYAMEGRYDLAIPDAEKAVQHLPRKAEALLILGTARLRTGNIDGALADATEAIKLEDGSDAYNLRGACRVYRKEWDLAELDFVEALRRNAKDPLVWANRGEARYYARDLEPAVESFTQALSLDAGMHRCRMFRAAALGELGRRDEAVQEFRYLLRTAPADWPLRAETERLLKELSP